MRLLPSLLSTVSRTAPAALALAALLASPASAESPEEAVAIAKQAAQTWLKQVDEGKYGASWDEAAKLFRAAMSKSDWESALQATRAPLGAVKTRTVQSARYATALPGVPDGHYVVIQFSTSFENKAVSTETVTPTKDKDGNWRVSGYYIK